MRNIARAFWLSTILLGPPAFGENPLFEHVFTADPAALVDGDTVWLYTGHDEAPNNDRFFEMHDWLAFSSTDMKSWTEHGPIMKATDFEWATGHAWAAHMVKKDGRFWFYTTVRHDPSGLRRGYRGLRLANRAVRGREGIGTDHQRHDYADNERLG